MKREHRLRYIIKEGLLDTFYIWKDELRNVFKDAGVMIFFFLVPFVYPLLYSFIYNNEVVHEAKMVVVDQSDSYLSREFTRRVNATPDVEVVRIWRKPRRCWMRRRPMEFCSFPRIIVRTCMKGDRQPSRCIAI